MDKITEKYYSVSLEPHIHQFLQKHYVMCTFSDQCECGLRLQNWTRLNIETGEAEDYWCTVCAIKHLLEEQKDGGRRMDKPKEVKRSNLGYEYLYDDGWNAACKKWKKHLAEKDRRIKELEEALKDIKDRTIDRWARVTAGKALQHKDEL